MPNKYMPSIHDMTGSPYFRQAQHGATSLSLKLKRVFKVDVSTERQDELTVWLCRMLEDRDEPKPWDPAPIKATGHRCEQCDPLKCPHNPYLKGGANPSSVPDLGASKVNALTERLKRLKR